MGAQVGDVLDRGHAELRILYFLERLQAQALAAGGVLHVLNGNHETVRLPSNSVLVCLIAEWPMLLRCQS